MILADDIGQVFINVKDEIDEVFYNFQEAAF